LNTNKLHKYPEKFGNPPSSGPKLTQRFCHTTPG